MSAVLLCAPRRQMEILKTGAGEGEIPTKITILKKIPKYYFNPFML